MTSSPPSPIVRFAPSPTGRLHIGNLRTALYNWLYAKKSSGTFILRLDDTDTKRATKEFADGIIEDLDWLGLHHDRLERQSERITLYDDAAEKLKSLGLLYPCYESSDEIDRRRKRLMARGLPPIYDRTALNLTDAEKASFADDGMTPHWRFLLPNFTDSPFNPTRTDVHWNDTMRGEQTVDLSSLSDPVLIREDGSYLYTLPSVIDDLDMGVTHVIRGGDHITNTGAQIPIFEALGGKSPNFGHHNLLTDAEGEGLSKRKSALSLESIRERGIESMSLNSLSVLLGTGHSVEPFSSLSTLGDTFDPSKVSKSPSQFRIEELDGLNERFLHNLDYADAKPRLEQLGLTDTDEHFWLTVRPNIAIMSESIHWHSVITGSFDPLPTPSEDKEFLSTAVEALSALDWQDTPSELWTRWTGILKDQTGRKGKELFMPLRRALTGQEHGPDMGSLLPLLGRESAISRLTQNA